MSRNTKKVLTKAKKKKKNPANIVLEKDGKHKTKKVVRELYLKHVSIQTLNSDNP